MPARLLGRLGLVYLALFTAILLIVHFVPQADLAAAGWRRLVGAGLMVLAVSGLVPLVLSRFFDRRVMRLEQFARRLAQGDFHS